ncbi:MAG: AraC family transcriptional regulator [Bacteroidota bacterium]
MKPEYEKIVEPSQRSFTAKVVSRLSRPLLRKAWHYHPEIEICFSIRSHGKRFVGNQISDYAQGDLVMFGPNLPHGFTTQVACEQVVIQMTEDFWGKNFLEKPELRNVRNLLQNSKRGLFFGDITQQEARLIIRKLMNSEGFLQMIYLFELVHCLAEAQDIQPICSEEYSLSLDATHLDRLKLVYDYILSNYNSDMRIKEVADQINLTEAAFFKFIKKHTQKTFTEIVNEIRINEASKLLMMTDMSITAVCYECGYNNISYFNRKFKAIMGKPPREFREEYV